MKTNLPVSCVVLAGLILAAGNLSAMDNSTSSTSQSRADMSAPEQVCVSKLIGKNIKNDQNQTIGEVKDIVLDNHATARYAIISAGGTAGVGAKRIAVPMSSLQCSHDGNVRLSATKEDLKAASPTPQGTWVAVQGQAWTKNVDGFYGQPLAVTRYERDSAEAAGDLESVRDKAAPQTLNIMQGENVGNDYTPKLKSSSAPANSSDLALQDQIHQKLEKTYTTEQLNSVRITVNNGVVILSGSVKDEADRAKIESQTKAVSGVNQVDNQLTVRGN